MEKSFLAFVSIFICCLSYAYEFSADTHRFPCSNIIHDSIPHPLWQEKHVHVFRNGCVDAPSPLVLFCHGITATDPKAYEALIHYMVLNGSVVVYAPYGTVSAMFNPKLAYLAMFQGFMAGVSAFASCIDTGRMGVVGHSYGAGAVPWIANTAIRQAGWGREAAYLFAMAPWYMHGLSARELREYPAHARLVVQVYEDDRVNDHRMAKDMYRVTGVPLSRKTFMLVHSDSSANGRLTANHDVPTGSQDMPGSVNNLDVYAVYRTIHALEAGLFYGNPHAENVAPGSGGMGYNYMGMWPCGKPVKEITRYSRPLMLRTQPFCVNFWHHAMNPRTMFFSRLKEPVRIVVHTPVTVWNYALLVHQALDR